MKILDLSFLNKYNPNSLPMFIFAFYIGIVIASLCIYYNKFYLGSLVRKLLKLKANSPQSSKSLKEIGCDNFAFRKAAKSGGLSKLIKITDDKKYYIPEENRIKAELRYEKKGNDLVALIVTIAVFTVIAAVLTAYTVSLEKFITPEYWQEYFKNIFSK